MVNAFGSSDKNMVPAFAEIPINSPPEGKFPAPPVKTLAMSLPFGELAWENFERLCYRLAAQSNLIEHTARYGRQGQAQQGIDIFARQTDGRYEVWQAKRYQVFTATQLKTAVTAFTSGNWIAKSDKLVIAVQATLDDVKVQDEIERQTQVLAKQKIALIVLGGDSLTDQLRPHQELVLSFFGRAWLRAFYGDEVKPSIAGLLDGEEFARVRMQVASFYQSRYSTLDAGIVNDRFADSPTPHEPIPLLNRYAMPDVYIRDRVTDPGERRTPSSDIEGEKPRFATGALEELRRVPVGGWIADTDYIAVVADAGAGKSTLLRCIALDLLGAQKAFPALCSRWNDRLPIIVSFAKWARATADKGSEVGLKELVAQTLQPLLTVDLVALVHRAIDEHRIVLIVDGLDEWSAEQAARLALQTMLTYVDVHKIPTITSSRPLGLQKIGMLPGSWKTAELAPLSRSQQRALAQTWFNHLLRKANQSDDVTPAVANWRTDRFLKELQDERSLGDLAVTPLLFVGLLALAVRNVALPRNRTQVFQSLIHLLLEIHPENRATAAGDVKSRFAAAVTPELRQSALGALAFASRCDGGDAGFPRASAKKAIRTHLNSSGGYEMQRASDVADEIVAVNSETVGLIVEKGPGDIGFVHASLEEYLSAVHIHSWRFADLLNFVREKVGDPRWRNVIANLVALNTRTTEIDEIIKVIEAAEVNPLGAINRRKLLAEITFSPSSMPPSTASRIASQTFEIINGLGPAVERVSLLRLALNGLSDPMLRGAVEENIVRWAPRRLGYTSELYNSLVTWAPDGTLENILIAGLSDENSDGARAAARMIAEKFPGQEKVGRRLRSMITGTSELRVVAATLEALVRGWPNADTDALVEEARSSRSPLLRAVGIWARVKGNIHNDDDRSECLRMVSFPSPLDYIDHSIASEALFQGWPDDDEIVECSLGALGFSPRETDTIDRHVAASYLLQSSPGRANVDEWILYELDREYPFASLIGSSWGNLIKFCEANAVIRERIITFILSGKRTYREREHWEVIAFLKDTRLRDYAIGQVLEKEDFGCYWNLLALVKGWPEDTLAQDLFRSVIAIDDDKLGMLAGLLPALYANPADARNRLVRIARHATKPRYDLIAKALHDIGIDGSDEEVVEVFLPHVSAAHQTLFGADVIFALFGESLKLRQQAYVRLQAFDPPVAHIARGMGADPKVRDFVSDIVRVAPAQARSAIAVACGTSADRHPALLRVLSEYDHETNFLLRVQLVVDYSKLMHSIGERERLVEKLLAVSNRTGALYEENRATGFAGLVAAHSASAIVQSKAADREITLGSYYTGGVSSALCNLVVDNWDELKAAFGDNFAETHLKTFDGSAWESLSRFVTSNLSAKNDFIAWCMKSDQIGLSALRSLSDVAPKSDVLLKHALSHIKNASSDTNTLPVILLAAEICRDQFTAHEVTNSARERFLRHQDLSNALVLAVLSPNEPLLRNLSMTGIQLGTEHGEWFGAVEMTSRVESAENVVKLIHALADRKLQNRSATVMKVESLVNRVIRDSRTQSLLHESLTNAGTPSAFCAVATILSTAGILDENGWNLCVQKLSEEEANHNMPRAVLDISVNEVRPLSHVLTDLLYTRSTL